VQPQNYHPPRRGSIPADLILLDPPQETRLRTIEAEAARRYDLAGGPAAECLALVRVYCELEREGRTPPFEEIWQRAGIRSGRTAYRRRAVIISHGFLETLWRKRIGQTTNINRVKLPDEAGAWADLMIQQAEADSAAHHRWFAGLRQRAEEWITEAEAVREAAATACQVGRPESPHTHLAMSRAMSRAPRGSSATACGLVGSDSSGALARRCCSRAWWRGSA
jgi:hypothetical protein